MIVDDNPNNLKVLGGMLQQAGYKVRPALSGALALRALHADLPDLVLLDIRMPDLDGYEVCRRIKADPALREVPVIFISALHDMEDKVGAFHAGGVDYIVKPFQLEEVLIRVRTHLELAQARHALQSVNAELEQRVAERTRQLEASNESIRFSVQEEQILGELLALGLQHSAVGDFLERALAVLDTQTAWPGADARSCLIVDSRSELVGRLHLMPEQQRPQVAFMDTAELWQCADGACLKEGTAYFCDQDCAIDLPGAVCDQPRLIVPVQIAGQRLGMLIHHAPRSDIPMARWRNFLSRVANVFSMGMERRLADDRIEHMAYHDELTGLPNRRLLTDRLSLELVRAQRHQDFGALVFIDLDRFKTVNDALGHAVGDRYLCQVSGLFRAALRGEDTLSRWGGDEFLVLLPSLADNPHEAARRAHRVAAELAALLAEPIPVEGHDLQLDASMGICLYPLDGDSSEELLSHADTAMYQAKQSGRNSICFFEARMQTLAEQRLQLEKALRGALERDEFVVYYQPQTDAAGKVVGVEALVRWNHPERGLVGPMEFIPVAEESSLIVALGNWVLRSALEQQVRWRADAGVGTQLALVSVNVSPRQFHQPDFPEQVEAVLAQTGADPHALELEVTESMLLDDIGDAIRKMTRLQSLGIRFAVDDFGTGYSSLAYLKRLPLNRLKIDQSFVRDVHKDHQDAAIVSTIIAMAQHLQLGIIAEGVETEAEWIFLRAAGCPAFQGYLFGRPMPAEAITQLLSAPSSTPRPS